GAGLNTVESVRAELHGPDRAGIAIRSLVLVAAQDSRTGGGLFNREDRHADVGDDGPTEVLNHQRFRRRAAGSTKQGAISADRALAHVDGGGLTAEGVAQLVQHGDRQSSAVGPGGDVLSADKARLQTVERLRVV